MNARSPIAPVHPIYHPDLIARDQWVLWRYETRDGKPTKVPYNARLDKRRADSTLPGTWAPFAVALRAWQASTFYDGIGYVFAADDPYTGVDIDHCRDAATGVIEEWAVEIIRTLAGYAELSPSGTGVHIWVRGVVSRDRNVVHLNGHKIEIYDAKRFFTVTGWSVTL